MIQKRKNFSTIFFVVILCICFLLFYILSCFVFNKSDDTSSIYSKAIEKTVEIRCFDSLQDKIGYATGAIVSANGDILTNKHVVFNKGELFNNIQIRFFNEENYIDAIIKKIDNEQDLALISIEKSTSSFFQLGTNVIAGDKVYTIGNPNGIGLSFSSGVISSAKRIINYNEKSMSCIQTDIVINEGNSGGPLFNANLELIGLISFRLKDSNFEVIQGVSFALNRDVIFEFLK